MYKISQTDKFKKQLFLMFYMILKITAVLCLYFFFRRIHGKQLLFMVYKALSSLDDIVVS